jgi:hypothetical protein
VEVEVGADGPTSAPLSGAAAAAPPAGARLSYLKAWLFWWQFVASLAWVVLTLVLCVLTDMSVCNISSVELLMFLFGVFWGMCGESSCNIFLLLFMVLWVPISAMPCRRAGLTVWHAFMFLGLRTFPLFFFLLGGLCCFFLLINIYRITNRPVENETRIYIASMNFLQDKSSISHQAKTRKGKKA